MALLAESLNQPSLSPVPPSFFTHIFTVKNEGFLSPWTEHVTSHSNQDLDTTLIDDERDFTAC